MHDEYGSIVMQGKRNRKELWKESANHLWVFSGLAFLSSGWVEITPK
jgi:hypothetical protein